MILRRQFMQGIATGAVLSASGAVPVRAQGLGTDYDVIVIGAGVAGLATAEHLASLDGELKILVLEARDRIGGRIHSVSHENLFRRAELGALYLLHDEGSQWSPIQAFDLNTESLAEDRLTLFPGMSALVEALAAASSGKVQLSSEVTDVFWRQGLVGVNYLNRGLSSAVTARRLVFALPPGVMREGTMQVTPPFAEAKRQAFGAIDTPGALTCAAIFSASDAALRGGRREWVSETESSRLRAFTAGPEGEVLLEAQYTGERARALAGQSEDILLGLSLRAFEDALESLPSLTTALWRSSANWGADPFSRGARSRAGATTTHLSLAGSLDGTLFFAGEATADPSEVGTVHGAYASGRRAAREVALSFGVDLLAPDANEPILELL